MATDITLDPAQGQTLEAWAKAIPGNAGIVRLAPGDHGRPILTGRRAGRIDIWGQPGAVVRGAQFRDTAKWLFRRVKFQPASLAPPNAYYAAMVDTDALSNDINFGYGRLTDGCDFSACDDLDAVAPVDRPKLQGVLLRLRGRNMAAAFSTFHDCRSAISLMGVSARAEGCVIERFTVDGILYEGDSHQILNNIIRDARHHPEEREHSDGIQGGANGSRNVLIQGNTIGPSLLADYMQGITQFDGTHENLTIRGNDVTPSGAYEGITTFGAQGLTLEDNAVRQDGRLLPWMRAVKAKDGTMPTRVLEQNNTAPRIIIEAGSRI